MDVSKSQPGVVIPLAFMHVFIQEIKMNYTEAVEALKQARAEKRRSFHLFNICFTNCLWENDDVKCEVLNSIMFAKINDRHTKHGIVFSTYYGDNRRLFDASTHRRDIDICRHSLSPEFQLRNSLIVKWVQPRKLARVGKRKITQWLYLPFDTVLDE